LQWRGLPPTPAGKGAADGRAITGQAPPPADVIAHIVPQLTSYKRASEIILMDALPATSTGKLLKHKLAETLRG